jgi:Zn-dependent protease with chaperone function
MTPLQSALLMGLGALGLNYFFKLLQYLSTKKTSIFTENDYIQDVFIFVTYVIAFFIIFSVIAGIDSKNNTISQSYLFLYILVIQTIMLSIPYAILPLFYLIKSKHRSKNELIENWIFSKFKKKYKVYLIEADITNAFATGILPFSKIILIGRALIDKLSEEELKSIVTHEMGHLSKNHLLKAFVYQSFIAAVVSFLWTKINPVIISSPYYFWFFVSYFGLVYGLSSLIILGLVQKISEKEADVYAAKLTSPKHMVSALNKLNQETKGAMEKWSFNYPTLKERIENINKL